jgi:predicted Zn-dependent protease
VSLDAIDALGSGELSGAVLLNLSAADLDALVTQALHQAEHGQVPAARDRLVALARVMPERPVLPLLIGHLEAQLSRPDAALAAYAEAARRLAESSIESPELRDDIELARAEVELSQGAHEMASSRLTKIQTEGSIQAQARAQLLLRGVQS